MYGPKDNFELENSHVLPALIKRFVTAAENEVRSVTLWGTGRPMREFLHSRDLAQAVLLALDKYDDDSHLNIGTGEDLTIKELAAKIAKESGFEGEICWDSSKPDGTQRKVLDITRLKSLGWKPKITLEEGIRETIKWFKGNRDKVRT